MGKFSKRKKSFYMGSSKKKQRVDTIVGTVGFLGTCNSYEVKAVREGYDLLNHFANKIYGEEVKNRPAATEAATADSLQETVANEEASEDEDVELDVDAALKKEVSSLQDPPKSQGSNKSMAPRRFQSVRCMTSNNVFFRTTLDDPLPTLLMAMDDILDSKLQRTKYLVRLLPVHIICKAYQEKIEKAFSAFVDERLKGQQKSFYLVVKITSNNSIKNEEVVSVALKVMEELAPECKPVLTKDADIAINISILSTDCYIGEAPLFLNKYKRYNLIELAKPDPKTIVENVQSNNTVVGSDSISKDSNVAQSDALKASDNLIVSDADAPCIAEDEVPVDSKECLDARVSIDAEDLAPVNDDKPSLVPDIDTVL